MQSVPDPYSVLGLRRDSTLAEVKSAHRRLAKRHHPDSPGGDRLRFLAIQAAYQLLSDPTSRRDWDAHHAPGPVGAWEPPTSGRRSRRAGVPRHDAAGTDTRPPAGGDWREAARSAATAAGDAGAARGTWSADRVPWWGDRPRPRSTGRRSDGAGPAGGSTGHPRSRPRATEGASAPPPGEPGARTAPTGTGPGDVPPAPTGDAGAHGAHGAAADGAPPTPADGGGAPGGEGRPRGARGHRHEATGQAGASDGPRASRRGGGRARTRVRTGSGTGDRQPSGDMDVYVRSSGAAWSAASRAYFRRVSAEIPRGARRSSGRRAAAEPRLDLPGWREPAPAGHPPDPDPVEEPSPGGPSGASVSAGDGTLAHLVQAALDCVRRSLGG